MIKISKNPNYIEIQLLKFLDFFSCDWHNDYSHNKALRERYIWLTHHLNCQGHLQSNSNSHLAQCKVFSTALARVSLL